MESKELSKGFKASPVGQAGHKLDPGLELNNPARHSEQDAAPAPLNEPGGKRNVNRSQAWCFDCGKKKAREKRKEKKKKCGLTFNLNHKWCSLPMIRKRS